MAKLKSLTGTVISDKMQKTRVVRVMHKVKHPIYGKIIKRYNKFKVHDEKNLSHLGDVVKISLCRPVSKEKSFRLMEIVKKASVAHVELKDEQQ
jgi:small subunit ribosomal protein S17